MGTPDVEKYTFKLAMKDYKWRSVGMKNELRQAWTSSLLGCSFNDI